MAKSSHRCYRARFDSKGGSSAVSSSITRSRAASPTNIAVCWAAYILLAKRMLADWPVAPGLALTLLVAAVLLAPFGLAAGGSDLLDARVLAVGLAVAVLGSVLPFTLELGALGQLSAATFGILLSLEPAVAAFAGAVALGQVPSALEALAIVLVVAASVGASLGARRVVPLDV